MAVIHDTTISPGKLELLTAWLPAQPWYLDGGRAPRILRPAGGADQPGLSAPWRLPDGAQVRGIFATADHDPVPGP